MFDTSWFKIVSFFAIWAILWLPIAAVVSRLIHWQPDCSLTPQQKLTFLGSLYLLSPIVLAWKISKENFSLSTLGLYLQFNVLISILLGLVFSIVSIIIILWVQGSFNLIDWQSENSYQLFSLCLPILCLSLLISIVEETIFRGYVLNTLAQDYPFWWAATLSSAIFALLHLIWERKQTLPQIPGLWLMGIVLVGARAIDQGSLGLAIGLHAGWIWGFTCIDSAAIITYKKPNSWLTGIEGQPLAGISGISGLIATGLVLWILWLY